MQNPEDRLIGKAPDGSTIYQRPDGTNYNVYSNKGTMQSLGERLKNFAARAITVAPNTATYPTFSGRGVPNPAWDSAQAAKQAKATQGEDKTFLSVDRSGVVTVPRPGAVKSPTPTSPATEDFVPAREAMSAKPEVDDSSAAAGPVEKREKKPVSVIAPPVAFDKMVDDYDKRWKYGIKDGEVFALDTKGEKGKGQWFKVGEGSAKEAIRSKVFGGADKKSTAEVKPVKADLKKDLKADDSQFVASRADIQKSTSAKA